MAIVGVILAPLVTAIGWLARELLVTRRTAPAPVALPVPVRPQSSPDIPAALATGQYPAIVAPGSPVAPRVLLVEDNAGDARLFSRELRRRGIEVHVARDGAEARALVARWGYALVIVDVHLPGEDGLSVYAAIRQRAILYSGAGEEEIDAIRQRVAADLVLSKDGDVVGAVVRLLGLPG